MSVTIFSANEDETILIGEKIGAMLSAGDIVNLVGDLGAGKTTITRGLCRGLKVDENTQVRSPTFTMINDYKGPTPVRHVDLYRVDSDEELSTIGLFDPAINSVIIVEWADKLNIGEGAGAITITITEHGENGRELTILDPANILSLAELEVL